MSSVRENGDIQYSNSSENQGSEKREPAGITMGGNGRREWVPRGRGRGNPDRNPNPNPVFNTNPNSNPKPNFVSKRNSHQNSRNPNRNFNANPNASKGPRAERNGDQSHYRYRQVGSGSGVDGDMQTLQLSDNQEDVNVNSEGSQGTDMESAGDNSRYLNMNFTPSQDFRAERNGGHSYQYRPVGSSPNVRRPLQSSKLPVGQSNASESSESSERSKLLQTYDNAEKNGPSLRQSQQRRPSRGRGRGGPFDRNDNKNYYRRIGISDPSRNTANQGINGQDNDERIGDCVSDRQNEASIHETNFTNEDLIGPSIDGNPVTISMGHPSPEAESLRNGKMMNSSQDWRCNLPPLPRSCSANQGIHEQETAEGVGDCDNDRRNGVSIHGPNYTNEDPMNPSIVKNQLTQSTGQQRREMKGFRNRKMVNSSQDCRRNLLHPPQSYESISTKQDSREKTNLDRSSVPQLVQEIEEKLNKGKVECMICYEIVGRSAAIWSCGSCYAIFHLHCVRKWARAPSSVDLSAGQSQRSNWRCPGCQSVQLSLPDDLRYYCFCGKVQEPEVEYYITPHSCGGPCGKPLEKEKKTPSCPHTCTLQCHPGPCPPCSAMAPPQRCPCGKTTITRRCSDHKSIESCGECCEKPLKCGRHNCDNVCHEGPCDSCKVLIKASCFCGEKEEMILCGDMEIQGEIEWKNGVFACKNPCMKMLSCQNHKCNKICHPGECGECELSPRKVKSCPCGKTQLQNQRKSCMDSVPTCSELCEKLLPCGKHLCIDTCHQGKCPPCLVSVNQKCRCGSSSKMVPCWKTMVSVDENDEFTCEKHCGQKKNCGRHRCSERCCPLANRGGSITYSSDWDPHLCQMPCGKKLQCGKHFCQELCHSGHCPPCLETIFTDLSCACGKTSIPPPVPCGTPIPSCSYPCSIPQTCGHPATHDCHFGDCPTCTVPVAKECVGGHVALKNVPCGSRDIRCNKLCGKPRQCGMHACTRTCHLPPCDSVSKENSSSVGRISCGQPCGAPRRDCRHTCTASCHPSLPCPDTRCELIVTITCSCGRLTAKVPCDAGGNNTRADPVFEASVLHKLPAPLQPVQSNSNRVPLGQRKLACDEECLKLEKKKILADAFGICTTVDLPGVNEQISELLAELIRREPQWVSAVEERFRYLVLGKTKASSSSIRVHVFGPMPKDKRDMLRHLAERWNLSICSAGWEPKRFLVIQATQKSRAPVRSIMPKGSLPTIGSVQAPPFNSVVDMDPRLVLALFDLPREAEVSSLILRFGGECELVWLNDKNALAIFTDPARAATALRRVDHASVYRGAIVVPHTGGLPNRNAWATKDGTAEKANAWKKNEQQSVWMEDSWGEDWSSVEVSRPVWQIQRNPILTTRNPYGALEKYNAGETSSTNVAQPSSKPVISVGSSEVSSSQENQNKYSSSEVDDWEKAFD